MLDNTFHYRSGHLHCDSVRIADIIAHTGTPVYIYSLKRALANYETIRAAFAPLDARIHYSAKANGNLALLRALVAAGAGIDTVSGGEIYRALHAGAAPGAIVFAGVGKTMAELFFAVDQNVGWFNIENVREAELLNSIASTARKRVRVAFRLNPNIQANTHKHIATGHGGAKFGLSADAIAGLFARQHELSALRFEGLHVHIGSQLHDIDATVQAVRAAVTLAKTQPTVNTIDIGGGFPVAYHDSPDDTPDPLPTPAQFAAALAPELAGYAVVLEPGRAIIADAGILVTRVQYLKQQGDTQLAIVDAGMTEIMRPALYEAYHAIVPLVEAPLVDGSPPIQIVGPVCETTDVLARDRHLPPLQPDDALAIMTAGAYGMVMASNYNTRPRPPEVVVAADGESWRVARRRETWDDLIAHEV
ncbi:MAG: diaminopimelate decarboxylase [Chloroflexota bacterium]|nr:diaminopimelate decarboxylase [Chloroflexota bacterium]